MAAPWRRFVLFLFFLNSPECFFQTMPVLILVSLFLRLPFATLCYFLTNQPIVKEKIMKTDIAITILPNMKHNHPLSSSKRKLALAIRTLSTFSPSITTNE
jgi:hypothetical protein